MEPASEICSPPGARFVPNVVVLPADVMTSAHGLTSSIGAFGEALGELCALVEPLSSQPIVTGLPQTMLAPSKPRQRCAVRWGPPLASAGEIEAVAVPQSASSLATESRNVVASARIADSIVPRENASRPDW